MNFEKLGLPIDRPRVCCHSLYIDIIIAVAGFTCSDYQVLITG